MLQGLRLPLSQVSQQKRRGRKMEAAHQKTPRAQKILMVTCQSAQMDQAANLLVIKAISRRISTASDLILLALQLVIHKAYYV